MILQERKAARLRVITMAKDKNKHKKKAKQQQNNSRKTSSSYTYQKSPFMQRMEKMSMKMQNKLNDLNQTREERTNQISNTVGSIFLIFLPFLLVSVEHIDAMFWPIASCTLFLPIFDIMIQYYYRKKHHLEFSLRPKKKNMWILIRYIVSGLALIMIFEKATGLARVPEIIIPE